jgi:hypothetical protein
VDFEAQARQIAGGHGLEFILFAVSLRFAEKGLSATRAEKQTRDIRFIRAPTRRGMLRHLVHAREHALPQVQSPSLKNANKDVFGVN